MSVELSIVQELTDAPPVPVSNTYKSSQQNLLSVAQELESLITAEPYLVRERNRQRILRWIRRVDRRISRQLVQAETKTDLDARSRQKIRLHQFRALFLQYQQTMAEVDQQIRELYENEKPEFKEADRASAVNLAQKVGELLEMFRDMDWLMDYDQLGESVPEAEKSDAHHSSRVNMIRERGSFVEANQHATTPREGVARCACCTCVVLVLVAIILVSVVVAIKNF